ncbi:MAG: hypothetical protein ACYCYO_15060 [Bacilli bacterium]
MTFEFANSVPETTYLDLDDAIASLTRQRVSDAVADATDIRLPAPGTIAIGQGDERSLTRSAFVQLLHFVSLNWKDVKDADPTDSMQEVQSRLKDRPGRLLLRTKKRIVQAILSPAYTPVTNLDILKAAKESLDMSKAQVSVFRGYLRLTGVTDRVTFQPAVGDILSGGWEIANNEFGKGALSMSQFVLRLVCTNGAVVSDDEEHRYVHRGWERDGLVRHLSTIGEATISRMGEMDARLRRMAETRLGPQRHRDLEKASARSLGKIGVEEFRAAVSQDSSVYDAYNHLTLVSQQKKLGPRRELELIAGGLLGATVV